MQALYPRNPAFYSGVIELMGDESDIETIRWGAIIQYARVMARKAMGAYYSGWRGYQDSEQLDTPNDAIEKIIVDHRSLIQLFLNGSLQTHMDAYEEAKMHGFTERFPCAQFFLENFLIVKSDSEESQEYYNGSPVRISNIYANKLAYAFEYIMVHSHYSNTDDSN